MRSGAGAIRGDELGDSSHRELTSIHDRLDEGNPQDDDYTDADPLLSADTLSEPLDGDVVSLGATTSVVTGAQKSQFRSRKTLNRPRRKKRKQRVVKRSPACSCYRRFCRQTYVRSTLHCMNVVARILVWCTIVALAGGVMWYSYELFNHGTDAHLVAWFSAGAFVLLGFPISMWGIVSHLANYNQPHVQVYVVRILWMVPIYSIESWLAMRFHKQSIYIETLRDLYESYVLYSFLQFLIQVLGGEEALILMLKDKSPTRGVHMWGLQWCVKPWLMGQPVRKTVYERDDESGRSRPMKRVQWKSPFFVKCKFGVLQYVLLKIVSALLTMILELKGWYREGDFTPKGGYLYICIVTNASQCWAIYCLIFFYYSAKNELSPIRPVGKFLAVKALVIATWYQQVGIAFLYQLDMIPHYSVGQDNNWSSADVAKALQDYLICIEMFLFAVVHTFVFPHTEYSPQAVEARVRALSLAPIKWQNKRLGRKYNQAQLFRDDLSKGSPDLELATLDSRSVQTGDGESWSDAKLSPIYNRGSGASSLDSGDDIVVTSSWEEDMRLPTLSDNDAEEVGEDPLRALPGRVEGDSPEETENDGEDNDGEDNDGEDDEEEEETETTDHSGQSLNITPAHPNRPGFVRALLDSAIPHDLGVNTVSLVKGEYNVERKTLLHHATTSDQYDLFSQRRPFKRKTDQD